MKSGIEEKPIDIQLEFVDVKSKLDETPDFFYYTSFSVSIRLDKDTLKKYIEKTLTIEDLLYLINNRK